MAEVALDNVTKVYPGDVVAVSDVTLHVADKELLVLVGPSGCGKSTTLRMVAGLEDATRGTIKIEGTVVNDVPPKDRDIAMVFQNYALYPHMTVYQNMAFGLKLRKHSKADIGRRVGDAASLLGIQNLLDRKPKALSGGQRQRVAIARALVTSPRIVLADEPTANLDSGTSEGIIELMRELNAVERTTFIFSTHDPQVMDHAERVIKLIDGKVADDGRGRAIEPTAPAAAS